MYVLIVSLICVLVILAYTYKEDILKEHKQFVSAKRCLDFFKVEVPKDYVIFHKNRDKYDNRFNNLEIISRAEMLNRIRKRKG